MFDFSALFSTIGDVFKALLLGLLSILTLFTSTGCATGPDGKLVTATTVEYEVTDVTMGTQFCIDWGTRIGIGFPGTIHGRAKGITAPTVELPAPPEPPLVTAAVTIVP